MRIKNELDRAARLFTQAMLKRGWSPNTVRAYERGLMFFNRWLVSDTTIESLNEITSETVVAWREELSRWKISEATRELRFAAVKTFFRLMSEAGAIDNDVAARVSFPQRSIDRVDARPVLSLDEIELAIASIGGKSAIALRDRAILKVLVYTGVRNSELRALTIDDADFADRTLLVRNGKGSKMRIVPMGRAAAALEWYVREARPKLAGLLANGALFLSREHRPLARKTLEGIVQRRLGVSPHRLRHACATSMTREGVSAAKVQAVLGHASSETTKIYVH
jgi:site-specific recombinase XerD